LGNRGQSVNLIEKMKTNKKQIATEILGVIFILFSISYVQALGFGYGYPFGNPLEFYPGQTDDIYVQLQNPHGENMTISAGIAEGSEIAKITDPNNAYYLPTGTTKNVNIRVSVPSDAKIGDEYPLKVNFLSVQGSTAGGLGFGASMNLNTKVIIIEKPKTAEELAAETAAEKALKRAVYLIIKIVVAVAIAAAIIFLCTRKKTPKRAKRSRR